MQSQVNQLANGALQAAGQSLANKVMQNPTCQQGLQTAANTLVSTGAAAVGTVVAVGHTATVVGTAVVTGATIVAAAAAPVAAVVATGYGLYKLWEWLDS